MKSTSKKFVALALSAIVVAGLLQSCGGTDNQDSLALQRKLDSTLEEYQRMKNDAGDYEKQLSSRDSAIMVQANEIQRLINELDAAKRHSSSKSSNALTSSGERKPDNREIERQQKEIRDKENTINKLQRQIEQQTKQIAELKRKADSGETKTDNSGDQKKLAKLQSTIDDQKKEIASLQSDVQRLRNENGSATNLNEKIKKEYEAQLASLNSQMASMNTQLDGCRSQLDQLNAQINAKNEEIKRLSNGASAPDESAELKQLRILVNELNGKEAECRREYEKLQKTAEQDGKSHSAEKVALLAQVNDLNLQIASLQSNVENLQNQNAELLKNKGGKQPDNSAEKASMQQTIDNLSSQVAQQNRQIAQLQADLQQKNQELEASKSASGTKVDAGTVNSKLAELQQLCDSYQAEIERLRTENEHLKNENAELKDRVANSADLFAENERLQQKVKLASVLVTSDLKVTPGKSIKTGNIVNPTNKAKKVKVIRIDCRILDNNVVDPGSMTIYARIATAANRVLANGQPESFDMSGVQMQYTLKQDIEFTGYGRALAMIWKMNNDIELTPGLYWMTLYAGGYEIGKVSFKLD